MPCGHISQICRILRESKTFSFLSLKCLSENAQPYHHLRPSTNQTPIFGKKSGKYPITKETQAKRDAPPTFFSCNIPSGNLQGRVPSPEQCLIALPRCTFGTSATLSRSRLFHIFMKLFLKKEKPTIHSQISAKRKCSFYTFQEPGQLN